MQVFYHHMYEYQKGLRHLILHTTHKKSQEEITKILEKNGIEYLISPIGNNINIFFGSRSCIEVLKSIAKDNLSEYTDEEDFILGIMLGYDRLKQCERYLERKSGDKTIEELIG